MAQGVLPAACQNASSLFLKNLSYETKKVLYDLQIYGIIISS